MPGFDVYRLGSRRIEQASLDAFAVAERMTGDSHFPELGRGREYLNRQLELGWESNGHDVGDCPASFEKTSGSAVKSVTRNGGEAASAMFQPVFECGRVRPCGCRGMPRPSVAMTRVIRKVHDHDRGARASKRKGQYKQHEHALGERRANLAIRAGEPEFVPSVARSRSATGPRLRLRPATAATPHIRRMCRNGARRIDRPRTPDRS